MRETIPIQSSDEIRALLGIQDCNARLFRSLLNVSMTVRNGGLQIDGEPDDVAAALQAVDELLTRIRQTGVVDEREVELLLRSVAAPGGGDEGAPGGVLLKSRMGRPISPRGASQKAYVQAMEREDVVFAIGPAGTGKTYLAVAMAVRRLREGLVKKLILTRPVVEAGEKLGFLPGTFEAKINPYLRPLYDALYDLLDPAQIRKLAENDVIEVAPLAYMRGRTLADAFIILDEAQNTTIGQMKMFLTRMGEGSRMVVTGDVTQIDLPPATVSGLVHARHLLKDTEGVCLCTFHSGDIVRHPVVQRIVDAYEANGKR